MPKVTIELIDSDDGNQLSTIIVFDPPTIAFGDSCAVSRLHDVSLKVVRYLEMLCDKSFQKKLTGVDVAVPPAESSPVKSKTKGA